MREEHSRDFIDLRLGGTVIAFSLFLCCTSEQGSETLSLLHVQHKVNFCSAPCSFLQFFEYACVLVPLEIQTAADCFSYRGCAQKQKLSVSNAVTHLLTAGSCIILINCSTKSSWCYTQIHLQHCFPRQISHLTLFVSRLRFCNLLRFHHTVMIWLDPEPPRTERHYLPCHHASAICKLLKGFVTATF